MYNVLIVDDESMLVDSLYEYVSNRCTGEFECIKAYSVQQAMEQASSNRVDIVILDIEMPVMNGIQLNERIRQMHPHCRAIFLTAYESFEYAYAAGQKKSRFLLKTEGYDTLLEVLRDEAAALDNDLIRIGMTLNVEEMILPGQSRNDFLRLVLSGNYDSDNILKEAEHYPMQLNMQQNVMPVLLHLKDFGESDTRGRKDLIRAAVFFSDLFANKYTIIFIQWDYDTILYLVQRADPLDSDIKQDLELFQSRVSLLTARKFSIALADDYCPWNEVAQKLKAMQEKLEYTPDDDQYICQLDRRALDEAKLNQIGDDIKRHIQQCNEERIRPCILEGMDMAAQIGVPFSEFLLAQFGEVLLKRSVSEWKQGYTRMLQYADRFERDPSVDCFVNTALDLAYTMDEQRSLQNTSELKHVVRKANEYIERHYAEDISLADIARYVCLSAPYLSRVYKKETGMNAVEKIKEVRVREAILLLRNTNMKIQDISTAVGYHSSRYFLSVFRAATGAGPTEYRRK